LNTMTHGMRMNTKENRLVIIVVLLLSTGFLVTSLASFMASRASLREEIIRHELPMISDTIYSEIQRDLMRPLFICSLMASDTFLRDWVLHGEGDADKIVRYLKEIRTKYNTVSSFFVSERTRLYYYGDGMLKRISPDSERDRWYFRLKDLKADYEINVDPDMANQDALTIFINHRVLDYDGRFIGATGVGITVHDAMDQIDVYRKRYRRNIFFTDTGGNIILHGNASRMPHTNIREIPEMAHLAPDILSGGDHSLKYRKGWKTIHLKTRYIPEVKWYLMVEQSEEETLRRILLILFINLGICFVVSTVVIALICLTMSSYQKRLKEMATTDPLTGIFNRRAFEIVMEQILKEVRREEAPLSFILFDIDYFKQINDRFGHIAGDAVLRHIVRTIRGRIRDADMFCRWGGEEFLILLKGCTLKDACLMAENIRLAVAEIPTPFGDRVIPATISLGVADHLPGEPATSFMTRADRALYLAKENGRNRWEAAPAI